MSWGKRTHWLLKSKTQIRVVHQLFSMLLCKCAAIYNPGWWTETRSRAGIWLFEEQLRMDSIEYDDKNLNWINKIVNELTTTQATRPQVPLTNIDMFIVDKKNKEQIAFVHATCWQIAIQDRSGECVQMTCWAPLPPPAEVCLNNGSYVSGSPVHLTETPKKK